MPFKCLQCTECCKRYYITFLPHESKRIAKQLKTSEKDFLQEYAQLYLQLFPSAYSKNKLVLSSHLIPKKLCRKLRGFLSSLPGHFLFLPVLAFKRKGKNCVFLKEKNCSIHKAKPVQCSLFPFISFEENSLAELYGFCPGLKKSARKTPLKRKQGFHFRELEQYFNSVKASGFLKQWKALPDNGVLVLKGKLVSRISRNDFLKSIEPAL